MKRKKLFVLLMCLFLLLIGSAYPVLASGGVFIKAKDDFSNNSSGSKERQMITSNSAICRFQVRISAGFLGKYRDGNNVPVTAAVTNESPIDFTGTMEIAVTSNTYMMSSSSSDGILQGFFPDVRTADEARNSVCSYRIPITVRSGETVYKTLSMALPEGGNSAVLRVNMEDPYGNKVDEDIVSVRLPELFGSVLYVGVMEENSATASMLQGEMFDNMGYEIESFDVKPEDLNQAMLDAHMPDILVMLDYRMDDLDEDQASLLRKWQEEGGVLLDFDQIAGGEIRREEFRNAPLELLNILVSKDTVCHLYNKRLYSYSEGYYRTELLNHTKTAERPSVFLYGILIGCYVVLIGPGIYIFLKRKKKRIYLWGGICLCSLFFVLVIGILGRSTRMTAPVITYLNEIRQYEDHCLERVNFEIQAPYNSGYLLRTDAEYNLVPCSFDNAFLSNTYEETESYADYERIAVEYGETFNEVELSNMSAFALNLFGMERRTEREEGTGLLTKLGFYDGVLSGYVKNNTGYAFSECYLIMPGYGLFLGTIKEGESVSLDGQKPDSIRSLYEWQKQKTGEESWMNYLLYETSAGLRNRRSDCLLVGRIEGKETGFWADSGYQAYGDSCYVVELTADMTGDNGVLYCPYAQEYVSVDESGIQYERSPESVLIYQIQTETVFCLNGVFEELPVGEILSVEFRNPDVIEENLKPYDGAIEIYNRDTDSYDPLEEWKLDFTTDPILAKRYLDDANQMQVRFTLADTQEVAAYLEENGYYDTPNLIVKAMPGNEGTAYAEN